MLALTKPIRIGDYVEAHNHRKGIVSKIGTLSTHLTAWDKSTIIIPNSHIVNND